MKTIYIDAGMGAAGDMLTAALVEALGDKEHIVSHLNSLGLPGITFSLTPSVKCGISGSHMDVIWNGMEEGLEGEVIYHEHHHDRECSLEHEHHHDHECSHEHEHHHEDGCCHEHEHHHDHECCHEHEHHHDHEHGHHHHSSLHDILHIVSHLRVSDSVKKDIEAVYTLIAEAESKAHGKSVEEIHFHEVGTMDAVADVTAVCYLMSLLQVDKVIVSPVHVGSGSVKCAHGIMPVPAPATAHILQGCPIYSTDIKGELCTPTGAALLKHFASTFGKMPVMSVSSIGYGMGKKDFEKANCVRVFVGEEEGKTDVITALECNLDDMTPEEVGFALEKVMEEGALDAYTVSIGMKKNRPGILFTVLCKEEDKAHMVSVIFRHTSTIGIRERVSSRYVLDRSMEEVETPYGTVHKKVSSGYGVRKEKLEYADLARIAKKEGLSLREVKDRLQ
ncbi:MAG: nickel pincer cofactor biosynthesis protein LarC [Spirochaetales bacterium]|nr:nickel pincer cofactor biosynthesis protein LarC [Candidatus Physcosoma equi]